MPGDRIDHAGDRYCFGCTLRQKEEDVNRKKAPENVKEEQKDPENAKEEQKAVTVVAAFSNIWYHITNGQVWGDGEITDQSIEGGEITRNVVNGVVQ